MAIASVCIPFYQFWRFTAMMKWVCKWQMATSVVTPLILYMGVLSLFFSLFFFFFDHKSSTVACASWARKCFAVRVYICLLLYNLCIVCWIFQCNLCIRGAKCAYPSDIHTYIHIITHPWAWLSFANIINVWHHQSVFQLFTI